MGLFRRPKPNIEAIEDALQEQGRRVKELLEEMRDLGRETEAALRALSERVDSQGKTFRLLAEEVEERVDRGNKVWRKIRASEYYEKEREEREEDDQPGLELYPEHGAGGGEQEVPPLQAAVGGHRHAVSTAREVGKALARRKMGLE
jgi:hypothetical protein